MSGIRLLCISIFSSFFCSLSASEMLTVSIRTECKELASINVPAKATLDTVIKLYRVKKKINTSVHMNCIYPHNEITGHTLAVDYVDFLKSHPNDLLQIEVVSSRGKKN